MLVIQFSVANTHQRHAFLFVGYEYTEGRPLLLALAVEEVILPSSPPSLPEPVDGLWLAGGTLSAGKRCHRSAKVGLRNCVLSHPLLRAPFAARTTGRSPLFPLPKAATLAVSASDEAYHVTVCEHERSESAKGGSRGFRREFQGCAWRASARVEPWFTDHRRSAWRPGPRWCRQDNSVYRCGTGYLLLFHGQRPVRSGHSPRAD
jgi:hypothetical protein